MSNLLSDQKDSYVAVKSGKAILNWKYAVDYLQTTLEIDLRKMDRAMIKLLHACARVYVNQFEMGRPTTVYMINTSLCDNRKLADRILILLFLNQPLKASKAQSYINSKRLSTQSYADLEIGDLSCNVCGKDHEGDCK